MEWQERKADTFTVSPYHSGNYRLGYRSSRRYGGQRGISLATAVTISGAAVSPNMGYMMTSSVVRLLMTLCNLRLGWWLGNPGTAGDLTFDKAVPRHILRPLLAEAFGQTDETNPYVYLSDGGHFDNLGVYEMTLRRCRFIMVSDASTDPNYEYESLAQSVRKIRIDQGIPIEFRNCGRVGSSEGGPMAYGAVAKVLYSGVDGTRADNDGDRLYLQPALIGNEPRDVVNYGKKSPSFPQEPISGQFFTESQFESYRVLGDYIASQLSAPSRNSGDLAGLLGIAAPALRKPVLGEKIVDKLKELRKMVAAP